jgi:signal transduction histidine kinase
LKAGRLLATLVVTALGATFLFALFIHRVMGLWLDVALHPEVREVLERSLADQKRLRQLDPAGGEEYRRRFERAQTLLRRIDVIRMNRDAMLRRFEIALVVLFAATVAAVLAAAWMRGRRAEERKRREYAERLAAWQEAARRHAHELRTPLTAARLELEKLASHLGVAAGFSRPDDADRLKPAATLIESVVEELDRLARYTRQYASFGALGEPVLRTERLDRMVDEFCTTFAAAWPGVALRIDDAAASEVCADRDLVRQVLVNLCANSARAGAKTIAFAVDRDRGRTALRVADDGAGIPPSLRGRIFNPYVTTSKPGEGMGLGLVISRKIMLDHGGDLVLASTSPAGSAFRLIFGEQPCS